MARALNSPVDNGVRQTTLSTTSSASSASSVQGMAREGEFNPKQGFFRRERSGWERYHGWQVTRRAR